MIEIQKIYEEFNTPPNVIGHMRVVADFASQLCDKFTAKGYNVDKDLVVTAALLHDVLRASHHNHESEMANILNAKAHPELANLVLKHGFFEIDNLKTWEEKILYYADKRVDHTTVVSLKVRMEEGKKRNFKSTDDIAKVEEAEKKVIQLEQEIANAINPFKID